VWFNLAVVLDGGPDEPILSKRSLGDRGWQLYVSDEDIVFDVAHNMAMYQPPLYGHGPSLQAGLWYHSVAIYKAGSSPSLSVYVNGDWVGTQYADGGAPITQYNSGNNVHLGASAGCTLEGGCPNVQLFNGLIAQVEVFGTDLSPCQVEALP
jgi:hypothetical protein